MAGAAAGRSVVKLKTYRTEHRAIVGEILGVRGVKWEKRWIGREIKSAVIDEVGRVYLGWERNEAIIDISGIAGLADLRQQQQAQHSWSKKSFHKNCTIGCCF